MSGYLGSSSIVTSQGNDEIVPQGLSFYKFSFLNYSACTVKINNSDPIYLAEGQGFSSDIHDAKITSFIIVEPNIQYNWIGAYRVRSTY